MWNIMNTKVDIINGKLAAETLNIFIAFAHFICIYTRLDWAVDLRQRLRKSHLSLEPIAD
jgi:hypothetical protein